MDLHNRLLILLFPNAYVKFQVVCGWLQEILGGFGWFAVSVVTQSNYKLLSQAMSFRYHIELKIFIKASCTNKTYAKERFVAAATFEGLCVVSFETE